MSKENRICKNCLYFVSGMCYYNPPTTIFVDYKWMAVHPPCLPDDRCSKWERNPRKISEEACQ